MKRQLLFVVLIVLFAGGVRAEEAPPPIRLRTVLKAMRKPVQFTHDGTDRNFIVEQVGYVRIFRSGELVRRPYLDLSDKVFVEYECGILGIAFHPQFQSNGLIYVNYTAKRPKLKTIISEFRTDPKADIVDVKTERVLLEIDQPFVNHNAGHLEFGPDGYLYIGMGDGGDGHDPLNSGQRTDTLLGKMLRIDVNGRDEGKGYAVPKDNPFVNRREYRPEIWATGIRNPWRYSFDPPTGLLYLADVGQEKWEEINIIEKGGNYGWRVREGRRDLHPIVDRKPPKMIDPIFEYYHGGGAGSVTGGAVYRGKEFPALAGWYFFGDYSTGRLYALKYDATERKSVGSGVVLQPSNEAVVDEKDFRRPTQPSAFGVDVNGEVYMCEHNGRVFRIVGPAVPDGR